MSSLPITIVVAHKKSRSEFFEGFCLPSLKANDPFKIEVMDEEGVPAAQRNLGQMRVSTPYVFHADDDLILRADCLKKMLLALTEYRECAFAYCDFIRVTMPYAPLHPWASVMMHRSGEWDRRRIRRESYVDTAALIRRDTFPGFDETPEMGRFHDWDLFLTMSHRGHKGIWVPELLYHAYNTDVGLSSSQDYAKALELVKRKHGLV